MQTVNQTSTPTKTPSKAPARVGIVTTALVLAAQAQAADGIDVSGATALFADGKTAAAAIGVAALVFAIGIVIYKRIRGAA